MRELPWEQTVRELELGSFSLLMASLCNSYLCLGLVGDHYVKNTPWVPWPTQSLQELKIKEIRGYITFSQGSGPTFHLAHCLLSFRLVLRSFSPRSFVGSHSRGSVNALSNWIFSFAAVSLVLSCYWGVIKLHMQTIFWELCSCRGPWIFSGEQISTFLKLSCLKHAEYKNHWWVTMC